MLNESSGFFGKHVSIINRHEQMFYDKVLSPYHIGCGQQFVLRIIGEYPGMNQLELSEKICMDKGTTARAVKKLEEEGYIIRESEQSDQRMKRLYATAAAKEVINVSLEARKQWRSFIMQGFTEEEIAFIEKAMCSIANKAVEYTKKSNGGIENDRR